MNPVTKALWFIERHFENDITLAQIAEVTGVSRFHVARAFGMTSGYSVMRYVRVRRLSEAAKVLAKGSPDIMMVALDAGYGSHEAFTRAFREQFGVTPDMARAGGTVDHFALLEAFNMDEAPKTTLQPPRIEEGRALLIAGLGAYCAFDNLAGLPALWQRFNLYPRPLPKQVGQIAYGVCYNTNEAGFNYIAGVEVTDFASLPKDIARLEVAKQRYAVFTHTEHVSTVKRTFMAIFNDWLPKSGFRSAEAPVFERYDQRFDARTGMGGFEIWVPVIDG